MRTIYFLGSLLLLALVSFAAIKAGASTSWLGVIGVLVMGAMLAAMPRLTHGKKHSHWPRH
jgi:hypothetical protein